MDFHTKIVYTARKRHVCCETGLPIKRGEKYVVYTGVCDGDFYSEKMKLTISELFNRLNEREWDQNGEGIPFGYLRDVITDDLRNPNLEVVRNAEIFFSAK